MAEDSAPDGFDQLKPRVRDSVNSLRLDFYLISNDHAAAWRDAILAVRELKSGDSELQVCGRLLRHQRRLLSCCRFVEGQLENAVAAARWFRHALSLVKTPAAKDSGAYQQWQQMLHAEGNGLKSSYSTLADADAMRLLEVMFTDTYIATKLFEVPSDERWAGFIEFSQHLGSWAEKLEPSSIKLLFANLRKHFTDWQDTVRQQSLGPLPPSAADEDTTTTSPPPAAATSSCLPHQSGSKAASVAALLVMVTAQDLMERMPCSQSFLTEVYCLLEILPTNFQDEFKEILVSAPAEILQLQLNAVHAVLTLEIVHATNVGGLVMLHCKSEPILRKCFAFVRLLHAANQRRLANWETSLEIFATCPKHLAPLEAESFYNDGVSNTPELLNFEFQCHLRTNSEGFGLSRHPYVMDAATKQWWLNQQNAEAMKRQSRRYSRMFIFQIYFDVRVRRSDIVQDALNRLTSVEPQQLRYPLRVIFDKEAGVDEGGLTKEFFQLLTEQLFQVDYGMFSYNEEQRYFWFAAHSLEIPLQFELIGTILGLAIYNNVILDVHLPIVLYKKLLKLPVGFSDLAEFQPTVARSLRALLSMDESEIAALCLTFSATETVFGETLEVPISSTIPKDTPLTIDNRAEYVKAYANWLLHDSVRAQFDSFAKGFWRCCSGTFIEKAQLTGKELMWLVCGSPVLDFRAWREAADYVDGYTAESETVNHFWQWVDCLDDADKRRLLTFVTGSDRAPLKGLSNLPVHIGRSANTDHIPSAHTCFNYLLLPDYKDYEKLASKMKLALNYCQGFGLR